MWSSGANPTLSAILRQSPLVLRRISSSSSRHSFDFLVQPAERVPTAKSATRCGGPTVVQRPANLRPVNVPLLDFVFDLMMPFTQFPRILDGGATCGVVEHTPHFLGARSTAHGRGKRRDIVLVIS